MILFVFAQMKIAICAKTENLESEDSFIESENKTTRNYV